MPQRTSKLKIALALATLSLLAAGVGCSGFFVDPVLTTITVGPPTPSIQQNSTLQMAATGTYDDGSQKVLTSNVFWSSSDSTIAEISNGGLLTADSPGSTTITASSGTASGTTTVTVTLANIISIQVTPTSTSILNGATQQYTAMATVQGGGQQVDVTDSVTWISSNTTVATIAPGGLATAFSVGTTQITAVSGTITSNAATLNVN